MLVRECVYESEFKAPHFATTTASSCVVMERLQGPINPASFIGEHLDVQCLNPGFVNTESLRFEGQEVQFSTPGLEEKMPFLQMLQSVECPPLFSYKEPTFQALLKLPYLKKPWDFRPYNYNMPETENQVQTLELESCVTHDIVDLHSPVKSDAKDLHNPHSSSCLEGASPSPEPTQQQPPTKIEPICNEPNSVSSVPWTRPDGTQFTKPSSEVTRERRKRKRTRVTKNKEEVESQRMTHIAVERNRRRQMNDHLNSLRSLMPPSYVQRGDQASIIGGAIDFVKELEQLLHSLEAQKRLRKAETCGTGISSNGLLYCSENAGCEGEAKVKRKSEAAEIEVTAAQNHVNLKVQCRRLPGQLLRAIVALEDLRLTILHLNVTSSQASVLYSFNLKIEDDCQLGSADEVASAVHQIFSIINGS